MNRNEYANFVYSTLISITNFLFFISLRIKRKPMHCYVFFGYHLNKTDVKVLT